jgi:hypothetical protein
LLGDVPADRGVLAQADNKPEFALMTREASYWLPERTLYRDLLQLEDVAATEPDRVASLDARLRALCAESTTW